MKKHIPVSEIVKAAGGNTAIIAAILAASNGKKKISTQAISDWIKKSKVPVDNVLVVARLSKIPAHKIRPDLPHIFPAPKKTAPKQRATA